MLETLYLDTECRLESSPMFVMKLHHKGLHCSKPLWISRGDLVSSFLMTRRHAPLQPMQAPRFVIWIDKP